MYRETAGKPKAARVQKVVDVKSDNPKHYQATSVLDQVNKQIVERGEKLPNGVLIPDKNGNGEGTLTDDHLKALEEAGVIDDGEFGKALLIQSEIEVPTKHGTLLVNKPIEQGRSEQFGGLTENYVVPTKWVLKKGRLYLEAMDLRQLEKNVDRAVKNKIAKELNLTRKKIYEDIEKSVEIQNRGQSTDAYYQSVDPKNWQRRKNFINSVQGQQTTRQLGINPMMQKVSPDLVTGIYRTFAFDRLQSAIKTSGDVVIPFGPTSYYSLRDNLMPQSPRFNRNGELVPQYKLEGFHGSQEKNITKFDKPTWIAKSKKLAEDYAIAGDYKSGHKGRVYSVSAAQGKVLKLWQFKDWVDLVDKRAPNNNKLKNLIIETIPDEMFGEPPSVWEKGTLFPKVSKEKEILRNKWRKENRNWSNFKKTTLEERKRLSGLYDGWGKDGEAISSSFSEKYDLNTANFTSRNDLVQELFNLGYDTLSQMEMGSPTYLVKDPKKIKITEANEIKK
jgi:hypothetical protein